MQAQYPGTKAIVGSELFVKQGSEWTEGSRGYAGTNQIAEMLLHLGSARHQAKKKLKKARSGKAEVLSGRQWGGLLNNAEEMTACLREERPQAAPTPWASGLWCRDDYVTLIDDCYSSVEALERGSGWLG
jgi:hypothetical protein